MSTSVGKSQDQLKQKAKKLIDRSTVFEIKGMFEMKGTFCLRSPLATIYIGLSRFLAPL
jgi:hypothetical protein